MHKRDLFLHHDIYRHLFGDNQMLKIMYEIVRVIMHIIKYSLTMKSRARISDVAQSPRSREPFAGTGVRDIVPFFFLPRSNFLRDGNKSLITSEVRRRARE